jgi:hypothetical protein
MPFFLGANWAAFSADIRRAGGFDPQVGPGGESAATGQETMMQKALIASGVTRHYLRDAVAWHYVARSRCSPAWALRRAYRDGISLGLRYRPPANTRHIFGLPLWMIRQCMEQGVAALTGTCSRTLSERFRRRYDFYLTLGRAKGMRHARRP